MQGKWHYGALATLASTLTVVTEQSLFSIIFFAWLLFLYQQEKLPLHILLISLLIYLFFYFHIPAPKQIKQQLQQLPKDITHLSGKVQQFPIINERKLEFVLFDEKFQTKFAVVYYLEQNETMKRSSFEHIQYGAKCSVTGKMLLPQQATNPYQFDYASYLQKQGIASQFIVTKVEDISCKEADNFFTIIHNLRAHIIATNEKTFHPEIVAWQKALIFGDRSAIGETTITLFQRWGLSHLLAISGLHVGIVSGLIYLLFLRFSILTKEKAQWFIIIFLPMFALIAGGQPSVWRASLMGVFILLLHKLRLRFQPTDILSIVFLSMLIIDKYMVYHIGFQFSFLVTFGLLLSLPWMKRSTSNVVRLLQINFVSQMVIVPLQMLYFYHFQPLSIIMNLLIVPYFSLIVIPLMFIHTFLAFLPVTFSTLLQQPFLTIHHSLLDVLKQIDEKITFAFITGNLSITTICIYYLLFILMMVHLEKKQPKKAFYHGIALSILLTLIVLKPYFVNEGNVTMLDIGQGDAYVIELPYRKGVFLIDAGAMASFNDGKANDRVYEQVIKPYLYGNGITQIDAIFITHQDIDHDGSIPFIMEDFHVKELIVHKYYDLSMISSAIKQQTRVTKVACDEKIIRMNQVFHVLAPCEDKHDDNENSLVLFTQIGNVNWLFTGDIGEITERELVERYNRLPIDVLKVAHHGSKTSSKAFFLQHTRPRYAFISVGRKNRYGHPAEETLRNLEEIGATIYRTDDHGAVQFHFINGKGKITTFLKEAE